MASSTVMILRSGCRRGSSSTSTTRRIVSSRTSSTTSIRTSSVSSWCTRIGQQQQQQQQQIEHSALFHNKSIRCFSSLTATTEDATTSTPTSTTSNSSNSSDENQLRSMMEEEEEEYDPKGVMEGLKKACQWNQGNRKWDYEFVRQTVDDYERHLRYLLLLLDDDNNDNNNTTTNNNNILQEEWMRLLSSEMTEWALKACVKMKVDTLELSKRVRELERLIGTIGKTPLTDNLSLALLEANGKAGNVGRALSLLQLRQQRSYQPRGTKEFRFAVQSIQSAGIYLRQSGRHIYYNDNTTTTNNNNNNNNKKQLPKYELDNPTRWLDAILLNMSSRNFQLTPSLANRMLDCYATTGKTGRALHFFYKLQQQSTKEDKTKIRMKMLDPPSYTKIPSQLGKQIISSSSSHYSKSNDTPSSSTSSKSTTIQLSKLEQEKKRDWSIPLTAAFAFADSLTHGACGHDPIQLNLQSYNALIKVCCYRGAMWRALELLEDVIPKQKLKPDTYTYNTILAALARVGDAKSMRDILTNMTNRNVPINAHTVEAISDGFLNVGDIAGAITWVQDSFNQHHVLPPYTTHLKILEFALANDLVFEAKRHVYFIQQLWKTNDYSSKGTPEFQKILILTQKNPKLSKRSLQRLFAYFDQELTENDFF